MRDYKALAEASRQAGLWPVRYCEDTDAKRLSELNQQYSDPDYKMVCGRRKAPWTPEAAMKWANKFPHSFVVEKNGVVVGALTATVPIAETPHLSAKTCPVDITLPPEEQRQALLSLALAFILFTKARGIGYVEVMFAAQGPAISQWIAQSVRPEAVGTTKDGAGHYRYFGTVDQAEQIVRGLVK